METKKTSNQKKISQILKGELGLVAILVFLCVFFTLSSPHFFKANNLLNVTRQISVVLIVSLGMLSVVLTGEIDLSVGSIAALSGVGYAWGILTTNSHTVGFLVGIAIGLVVGIFNGSMVVYGKIPAFIVTLASMGIVRGIALVWTEGKPFSGIPTQFDYLGAGYISRFKIPTSTIFSLLLVAIAYFFIQKTKHGVYIKAVGANENAATLSAVPTKKYKLLVFIISGLASAIGGIIVTSKLLSASPTASEGLEMDVLSAVILGGASLSGGAGTVVGTLIGALAIGVINNGMNLIGIIPFYQQIVKGAIILIAVLLQREKK